MKKIENILDWRPAFLHRIMGLAKTRAKMIGPGGLLLIVLYIS
jgi:hypothetical protein